MNDEIDSPKSLRSRTNYWQANRFALHIEMNQIFERTFLKAFREVLNRFRDRVIETQYSTKNLVTGGKFRVSIRPDILIRDEDKNPKLVADAKWKLGCPPISDFYQITSYLLAHDVPGPLIYPEQMGAIEAKYSVIDHYSLQLIELPIPNPRESFADYRERVSSSIGARETDLFM